MKRWSDPTAEAIDAASRAAFEARRGEWANADVAAGEASDAADRALELGVDDASLAEVAAEVAARLTDVAGDREAVEAQHLAAAYSAANRAGWASAVPLPRSATSIRYLRNAARSPVGRQSRQSSR